MSARFSVLGIVVALIIVAVYAAEVAERPTTITTTTPPLHPVVINRHTAPRVLSGATDRAGRPATIACGTCHAVRPPDLGNRAAADLDQFHQGLNIAHGTNSCLSCHDAGDYDRLKLADGRKVAFDDSITLCSQCHGPQRRDYDHGAHGGMNGYWDLSRGGRVRNTCVDCHDPHVPKYQGAIPTPRPRDRFQAGAAHE